MDGGNSRRPGEVVPSWVKVRGRVLGTVALWTARPGEARDPRSHLGGCGGSGGAARRRPKLVWPRLGAGVSVGQPPPRRHRVSQEFALRFPSSCAVGGTHGRGGSCPETGPAAGTGAAAVAPGTRAGAAGSGAVLPGAGRGGRPVSAAELPGQRRGGAGAALQGRGGFPQGFWQRSGGTHVPRPDGCLPVGWSGRGWPAYLCLSVPVRHRNRRITGGFCG